MKTMKELKKQAVIYIKPKTPFNFEGTFFKPSHFPSELVVYEDNKLYQTIEIGGKVFGLEIFNKSPRKKIVGINIYSDKTISDTIKKSIKSELIVRYDLNSDVSDFINKFKNDSLLKEAIKRWAGMKPSIAYSLYGFLMVATVLQNATVKRTVQMMDALLGRYGKKVFFAGKIVYAIWTPEKMNKIQEIELRNLKIGYRAKNIKRISEFFAKKHNFEEQLRFIKNKEEVKKILLTIYGVGPQSVSYLLFEAFHFYDALDHLSPWEGKIISMLLYGNKNTNVKKILKDVKKRWGKWKMLAVHYLFEDLFWRRKRESIPWLEEEIRI